MNEGYSEPPNASYTCFHGNERLASGALPSVARAAKQSLERGGPGTVLVFNDATGRCVEIDTRGTEDDVISRLPPPAAGPRGRGRPKLGVTAREVTLLPRHWEWLALQPGGASVALRKLVEEARRDRTGKERNREAQTRAYHFMSAIAGDLPGFEEATRALFANDRSRFCHLVAAWPEDVRDHATWLAFGADQPSSATDAPQG